MRFLQVKDEEEITALAESLTEIDQDIDRLEDLVLQVCRLAIGLGTEKFGAP